MAAPDFSQQGLAAAAGTDPWSLARQVTGGHPDSLRALATGFGARAEEAATVSRSGRDADHLSATSFTNDGAPVYDAEGSARQSRGLLSDDGEGMAATARVFTSLATDLTEASTTATRHLSTLASQVDEIVARRNAFVMAERRHLTAPDVEAADREFVAEAADRTREAGTRVQGVLDHYDQQVRHHTATLAGLPQAAPVPLTSPPPAAAGPLQLAGAVGAGMVDSGASLLNAMAHHPDLMLALAGGAALVAVSATGEAAGLLADATGFGIPAGLAVSAVSTAGLLTGGAGFVAAGAGLQAAATGENRVTGVVANPFGDTVTAPTMIDSAGNPWDRNSQWEKVTGQVPDGSKIAHDGSSRVHVPYGSELPDGSWSGGHWHEAGVANKTVFPPEWTPERILQETLDVARNPDQPPKQTERGTWETYGSRDDVEIKVILKPDGTILTAHPIRGPGVVVTDENGDPAPQGGN